MPKAFSVTNAPLTQPRSVLIVTDAARTACAPVCRTRSRSGYVSAKFPQLEDDLQICAFCRDLAVRESVRRRVSETSRTMICPMRGVGVAAAKPNPCAVGTASSKHRMCRVGGADQGNHQGVSLG